MSEDENRKDDSEVEAHHRKVHATEGPKDESGHTGGRDEDDEVEAHHRKVHHRKVH